ncbi:hypothetical protein E1267_05040 [Nonomuraea longispora]|uniref:Uncharacterized protein n=1 Tax=Nonomuraea longispora TaxID=1848320 RepID=A0A4R4NLX2_9ACTN|nr:hypothetical protein [Nonomuraea longispora]TDC10205.1 hypothetical protein E1267_05040 [Nonomuraea longispora]
MGQGVASASAGYVAVEAGGPPSAPVRHVSKPRRVSKEKPILRSPRWRPPKIDIIVHNLNRNKNKHRRHHRDDVRVEQVQPPVVENEDTEREDRDHRDFDHRDFDHRDHERDGFGHDRDGWWPIDGDLTGW